MREGGREGKKEGEGREGGKGNRVMQAMCRKGLPGTAAFHGHMALVQDGVAHQQDCQGTMILDVSDCA